MILRRSLVGFVFERIWQGIRTFEFQATRDIHSEDVSTQTWSSGKLRSLSPYLGGPFPRKDGFWPCRKETSSDFPGAGTHSRPDLWQRRHFDPDLSPARALDPIPRFPDSLIPAAMSDDIHFRWRRRHVRLNRVSIFRKPSGKEHGPSPHYAEWLGTISKSKRT
jgi:hypothetical protein